VQQIRQQNLKRVKWRNKNGISRTPEEALPAAHVAAQTTISGHNKRWMWEELITTLYLNILVGRRVCVRYCRIHQKFKIKILV
jgi:hypothetical protein